MNPASRTLHLVKRHPIAGSLALLALAGILFFAFRKKPELQLPPGITQSAKVEKGDVTEKVVETASLAPLAVVRIKSNATGMVSRLLVQEGDQVQAGQLLAVIQPGRPGEKYRPSSVLAPSSGIVMERNVEAGDTVTSGLSDFGGGTQLMSLAKLDVMQAQFEVNEVDSPKVKAGMAATLTLEALPGKVYQGKIRSLAPIAKPASGSTVNSFAAKVLVEGAHPELKPGMSALVEIVTGSRKNVLTLPVEAVFDDGGNSPTAYRKQGLTFTKTEIKTGLSDNHRVEILAGLAEGDEVSKTRPLKDMPARK